jgi:hypothetical protein
MMKHPTVYQFCKETGADIGYFVKGSPRSLRYPEIAKRTRKRFESWKRDKGMIATPEGDWL